MRPNGPHGARCGRALLTDSPNGESCGQQSSRTAARMEEGGPSMARPTITRPVKAGRLERTCPSLATKAPARGLIPHSRTHAGMWD